MAKITNILTCNIINIQNIDGILIYSNIILFFRTFIAKNIYLDKLFITWLFVIVHNCTNFSVDGNVYQMVEIYFDLI